MTTTELIEKYGIGHNCLSDAYSLGLADGLDGMEHAVEFAEEKARADAIDELSDLIDRLLWNYDKETYKDLSECFKESARLLKEQKNE